MEQTNLDAWAEEKAFIESLIRKGPIVGGRSWTRDELYEERLTRGHWTDDDSSEDDES